MSHIAPVKGFVPVEGQDQSHTIHLVGALCHQKDKVKVTQLTLWELCATRRTRSKSHNSPCGSSVPLEGQGQSHTTHLVGALCHQKDKVKVIHPKGNIVQSINIDEKQQVIQSFLHTVLCHKEIHVISHNMSSVTTRHQSQHVTSHNMSSVTTSHQSQHITNHKSQHVTSHNMSSVTIHHQSQVTTRHQSQNVISHMSSVTTCHQSQHVISHNMSSVTICHQSQHVIRHNTSSDIICHQSQHVISHNVISHNMLSVTKHHQ